MLLVVIPPELFVCALGLPEEHAEPVAALLAPSLMLLGPPLLPTR